MAFSQTKCSRKPAELSIDSHRLKENLDWEYVEGRLEIKLPKESGDISIKYFMRDC